MVEEASVDPTRIDSLDALLDAMRAHIEWAATNGVVFTDGVVCG